uniref:DUF4219 domain-containing protein n=1 Tax=Photinus pyralis TaxID=7054 RepID=A0A1Y1JXR9_PHOPY
MADEEKFVFRQFDGREFSNWYFRLQVALEDKGIEKWLETDAAKAVTEPDIRENNVEIAKIIKEDRACRLQITRRVADSHLEYLKERKTAFAMIQSLRTTFERTSIATEISVRKRMLLLRCEDSSNLTEHFLNFDKLVRELKACGGEMDMRNLIVTLFLTLSRKYDMVVTALETMDIKKLNNGDCSLASVRRREQIVQFGCRSK